MEKENVRIFTIANGWLVEIKSYWEDKPNKIRWVQEAFTYDEEQEEVEARKSRCDALRNMLYFIKEKGLEEFYQKHNTWNVSINLEKDGEVED